MLCRKSTPRHVPVHGLMRRQFDVHCKRCAEKGCWLCRLMCVGYGLRTLEVRLAICTTCILYGK